MSRYVDLDEKVTAQFYDEQYEEWTMQTVTIEDVLDSVCDEYTVLPSTQPNTEQIQKMQDMEQAQLEEAYRRGYEEAQGEIIRCKDCKEYCTHDHRCRWWNHGANGSGWCSYAERREG